MTMRMPKQREMMVAGTAATTAPRPRPAHMRRQGSSLIEMIITILVLGVLLSMGIPQFAQSLEQSRANVAGADLRAIWSAQRLYWLENRTYSPDLNTLLSANLIDPSLTTATTPYTYAVSNSSSSTFTATATRTGSSTWTGSYTIIQDGTFSGTVQSSSSATIVPGFQ
jgi:prepilin-type N-terminal cleavage/methylation domain-containing protein